MNLAVVRRALTNGTLALLVTVPAVLVFGYVLASGRQKLQGAMAGAILLAAVAYITGNPRLLCLWGLALTLPLSLAKRFGMILYKGGGENTFAFEASEAFLLALIGFQAWDLFVSGRRRSYRFPRFLLMWIAIMVMGVVIMFAGEWQRPPAHEVFRMFKVMVLFLVLCNELMRPKQMLHCVVALSIGLLGNCVVAAAQYVRQGSLGLQMLGEANPRTIDILAVTSLEGQTIFRVSALLLHPNIFGIYLASLLPLAIGGFLAVRRKSAKLFFLATIGAGTIALIATHSRSGWVSFAGSFTLLLFLLMRNPVLRRRSMLTFAVAAATVVLITGVFHKQIATRLFRSKVGATTAREVWKGDARRMIAAKPVLGHGLNNYVHALPPYLNVSPKFYGDPPWLPPVHHIYYLWLAETGIFGFTLYMLVWGSIVVTAIRNLRVTDSLLYTINAACLGAMLAFGIDGLFSFTLRVSNMARVFWFLSAIVYAIRYWHLRQIAEATVEEPIAVRPPAAELQPSPVQA